MKYGVARYEDQVYGDGPTSSGGSSTEKQPIDLHMIDPEGLTPGYEAGGQTTDLNRVEEAVPLFVATEAAPHQQAVDQMNELLKKKIDATLAGDTEAVTKLEQMITMHAQRNGIAYEAE